MLQILQLFAGHRHFDGPQCIASEIIRVVIERDPFGRNLEILRKGDVFREESLSGQLFVAVGSVLFVQFLAQQGFHAVQLLFGKQVCRG